MDSDHQGLFPIRPMVTIAITPAAFAAIEATPPTGSQAATRPDGKAGYLVTLPYSAMRGRAGTRPRHTALTRRPKTFKIAPAPAACVGARNRV